MLAEVCEFYGWTLDYVLGMTAKRFFLMLENARALRASRMSELCDIQAISICTTKWYEEMKARYSLRAEIPQSPSAHASSFGSIVPKDKEEEKSLVLELFATQRRLMGYG